MSALLRRRHICVTHLNPVDARDEITCMNSLTKRKRFRTEVFLVHPLDERKGK